MSNEITVSTKRYVISRNIGGDAQFEYLPLKNKLIDKHGKGDAIDYLHRLIHESNLEEQEPRAMHNDVLCELKPVAQVQLTAAKIKSL